MKGFALIAAGAALLVWLGTDASDPAPSAKYLLLLGVLMITVGVWIVIRGR